KIDEVAVYGTALTAAQVANHYALRTATDSVGLQLSATDPAGGGLTYSATGLPSGLTLNANTGAIIGDPLVAGSYSVVVTVTDAAGLQASQSFTWTVTAPAIASPHGPTLSNPGSQTTLISTSASLQLVATDP